jgi:hypothetical protein
MTNYLVITDAPAPQVATPTFSPPAETFVGHVLVSIACATPGATIYYAINSIPTTSSTVYTVPINFLATGTLNAIAVALGFSQSNVGTATYTLTTTTFLPQFPRLIGGRSGNASPGVIATGSAYFNWAQFFCVNNVTNDYPGSANIFGSTTDNWVQAYKAANVAVGGTKILTWIDLCINSPTIGLPGFYAYVHTTMNWDLYASGTSGTLIMNGSFSIPNQSTYAPTDVNGFIATQWETLYYFQNMITGLGTYASGAFDWGTAGADASINWDGFFFNDRWYALSGRTGDIQRLGSPNAAIATTDFYPPSGIVATAAQALAETWRAGQVQALTMQDTQFSTAALPQPFRVGNFDGLEFMFTTSGAITSSSPSVFGSFNGAFDMWEMASWLGWSFLEGIYGTSPTGVANMQKAIALAIAALRTSNGGPLVQIDAVNLSATGTVPVTWSGGNPATLTPAFGVGATGGNGMRYYLAYACMQSCGLSWTAGNAGGTQPYNTDLTTFDEFGNNGCSDCPPGYLGLPDTSSLGSPQTADRYANGIWERRFVNATTGRAWRVAMNPRGNGAQTYKPTDASNNPITVQRIAGPQNATYNTGAVVTAGAGIAMADTDGVFVYEVSAPVTSGYPQPYGRYLNFQGVPSTNPQSFASTAWQQSAARYGFIATASFGGIEQSQGESFNNIFAAMKSFAASSLTAGHTILTGLEFNNQEGFQTLGETGNDNSVKTNALNNNSGNNLPATLGWALQASGYPSGSKVTADTGQWYANQSKSPDCPAYTINTVGTLTGPSPTFGAVTWAQFTMWWEYQGKINGKWAQMENGTAFVGKTFAVNSNCNLTDSDNWFMTPRSNGCWQSTATVFNVTGSPTDSTTIAHTLQPGLAQAATMMRTLQPGILAVTNSDYFAFFGSSAHPQVLDATNQNFWDIALAEVPIGDSFSLVTRAGSFANFVDGLITQEQLCNSGGKPCFLMEGRGGSGFVQWGGNQVSTFVQADWQSADYQIGIAALLRWYPGIQPQSGNFVFWFDSWDAGAGQLGWWGTPVGARSLTPNAQGIYVIQYTGMTAYLYPAGANDATTSASYSGYPGGLTGAPVTLNSAALIGGGGKHIIYNGFSDSAVNTGATFTSLNLQPRSCVFTLP